MENKVIERKVYIRKLNKKGIKYFEKKGNKDCEFMCFTGLNPLNQVYFDSRTLEILHIGSHVSYHLLENFEDFSLSVEVLERMVGEYNGKNLYVDYSY